MPALSTSTETWPEAVLDPVERRLDGHLVADIAGDAQDARMLGATRSSAATWAPLPASVSAIGLADAPARPGDHGDPAVKPFDLDHRRSPPSAEPVCILGW